MDFATIFILILLAIYGLWKIIYYSITLHEMSNRKEKNNA